ncbi:MAG: hypothetical protein VX574_03810 [Myxococcota bacterium]|nr:hypothetical protein [Myxococcota bacterium]
MTEKSARTSPTRSRVEAFFARIGLVAAGFVLVVGVLAFDVWLTGTVHVVAEPEGDALDLVTRDGRALGRAESGVEFILTPETLYEHRPSQRADEGYWINAWGIRGPEIDRVPRRPRVLVVGGSAAFGTRGGPAASTLPKSLRVLLPRAEVLNGGVIGYLSSQERALVETRLIDLAPDWIVTFDGWNDLYDRYWWMNFGSFDSDHRGVSVTFNGLENRLANYRRVQMEPGYGLFETGISLVRNSTILSSLYRLLAPQPARREPRAPDSEMVEKTLDGYVANMKRLDEMARSRGSELLVVIQPELGQILTDREYEAAARARGSFAQGDRYWAYFSPAYRAFRREALRRLEEAGIRVLDASPPLAKARRKGVRFFVDPVHLSDAGNHAMAKIIAGEAPARIVSPSGTEPAEH